MHRVRQHVQQQFVGYIALFIALGGVSYAAVTLPANSVGSRQIKAKAVKSADLAGNAVSSVKVMNGSLLAEDFKAGQLPAGLPGAKGDPGTNGTSGAPGAPGATGATGLTGISNYGVVGPCTSAVCTYTFSATANALTADTLNCPAGRKVLGGGFFLPVSETSLVGVRDSFPSSDGTGWTVRVKNPTANFVYVTIYATCATVTG